MNDEYLQRRQNIKLGIEKQDGPKPKKWLNPIGAKKQQQINEAKTLGEDGLMDKFFADQRPRMQGVCQCGCAEKSCKRDDFYYKFSICHIFPKRIFESVARHPLNWVERKFWATDNSSACHTNMDEKSMSLWVNFADWEDIKAKFRILAPQLPDRERKTKFYRALEWLVNNN